MRKAKIIKEWRKLTIETIVQILEFTCDNNYEDFDNLQDEIQRRINELK